MNHSWKPQVSKRINLDDGTSIILLDMLNASSNVPEAEVENNIYRVTQEGRTLWQVTGARPIYARSPFTGMALEEGTLYAYRWDGGRFAIDIETGSAKTTHLAR